MSIAHAGIREPEGTAAMPHTAKHTSGSEDHETGARRFSVTASVDVRLDVSIAGDVADTGGAKAGNRIPKKAASLGVAAVSLVASTPGLTSASDTAAPPARSVIVQSTEHAGVSPTPTPSPSIAMATASASESTHPEGPASPSARPSPTGPPLSASHPTPSTSTNTSSTPSESASPSPTTSGGPQPGPAQSTKPPQSPTASPSASPQSGSDVDGGAQGNIPQITVDLLVISISL